MPLTFSDRLGNDLEVVVEEKTGPEDPAHVAVGTELAAARCGGVEVNGGELPDEVGDAAADGESEVPEALAVLDTGVDERADEDGGEDGEDRLA
jgi:hypothetical protein